MRPNDPGVKARRAYDGSGRRARAQQNRDAVIEHAGRLFLERGYAATTVVAIAEAAGVSVDLIYKVFGSKPGLVRAVRDHALGGAGPVPAEQRSDEMRASEPDPRAVIRNWGRLSTEVAPKVAPVLLLVRDAAGSDPEMAELRAELDDDRRRRMSVNARHLAEEGHLRDGITAGQATDVLWAFTAPELYELLVVRSGWSVERYGGFIADSLIAGLLGDRD